MTTLKAAAASAIAVQNACNLSGIVHSFSSYMPVIRAACPEGTEQINKHPICVLFATQIAHLAGISVDVNGYNKAYDECERLANEPDPVV